MHTLHLRALFKIVPLLFQYIEIVENNLLQTHLFEKCDYNINSPTSKNNKNLIFC